MHWIYILLMLASILECSCEKRILLNDVDLHQLQIDVQTIKSKLTNTENELESLKQTFQHLTTSASMGAVYTRWGRTDCPGNATLVYSGMVGGGDYSFLGSAAEYVCLPHNPEFNLGERSLLSYKALMYGAEYEDNAFGNALQDKDVPCAVCLANLASNVIMIPGKSSCVSGWKKEYGGRLASQASTDPVFKAAGQFVCLDNVPEVLEGGFENNNGKLFYTVAVMCGSLRCPPYIDGELLTCVVCSK